MRSKYKKKRSVEQSKKENKIVEQSSKDFSNANYAKLLSPEIKLKYIPLFNGKLDNKENFQKEIKEVDSNKENNLNKYDNKNNIISNIFKENNKNNNIILTSSYELKNKNISTDFNFSGKNYILRVHKENKYNNNYFKKRDKNNQKVNEENENKTINPKNDNINNNSNKEVKIINKENYASASVDMKITINQKESLKQLIHQAHKIKELNDTFNKNYIPGFKKERYKKKTYDPNTDKLSLDKDIFLKLNLKDKDNNNKIIGDKKYLKLNILKTEIISENDKNKYENKNIKILYRKNDNKNSKNSEDNEIKIERNKSSDKLLNIKIRNNEINNSNDTNNNLFKTNNPIINDNKHNNKNYGKSLSEKKYDFNDIKNKNSSFINQIPNNNIFLNDNNNELNSNKYKLKNNKFSATFINFLPNNNFEENSKKFNEFLDIDLEEFYNLAIKCKNIFIKIKNFQSFQNECLNWINYYFSDKIFDKIKKIFKSQKNKLIISNYIKIEILCIFFFYNNNEVFFNNFSQNIEIIKDLVNLLNENYLFILIYIINSYNTNIKITNNIFLNKDILISKINEVIKDGQNTKSYKDKIKDEDYLISLIMKNLKEIKNYYQILISDIYFSKYSLYIKDSNFINLIKLNENNINIISLCLELSKKNLTSYEKIGLISLFFIESIKTLNKNCFNFENLLIFFEKFLLEKDDIDMYNFYKSHNKTNNNIQFKYRDFSSINSNSSNQYFLPPIKKCYKYTLVLDLDETLIYYRKEINQNNLNNMKKLYINNCNLNNSNNSSAYAKTLIMRPGLLEFLHKMKQIFELVLFSLGTCDYVNKIVNIIEKKEKFFEYILYRQHATFNDNIYIKNLSLLGRDLKNIIIVDDKPQVFKLHQNNGICIKPFYGDVVGERNTLKILGNILQKIRFDADEYEGDIRKSLKYHSGDILTYITSNLESN